MNPTPTQAYIRGMLETHGRGEYGRQLDKLAKEIGVTTLRLYQVSNPNDTSHQLTPHQAIKFEILSGGAVPCESTNKSMVDLVQATLDLISFRARR